MNVAERLRGLPGALSFAALEPVFPAVTCTAQASFRTGAYPAGHGMIANGVVDLRLKKILFWEQAASLVAGPRIWDGFRARGGRVGIMFWQQSLGEQADLIVSPRPIHKHSGGLIQAVYTQPAGLYERLCQQVGHSFNLMHYWGPLASRKSTEWIVSGIGAVMAMPDLAPELLLTYLPHLDYDQQRYGPNHSKVDQAVREMSTYLSELYERAREHDYDMVVVGDYAIGPVTGEPVYPNRALREAGLFGVQTVRGMAYPDLFAGRAFAMVDHEVAHVYVPEKTNLDRARRILDTLDGVAHVLDRPAQSAWRVDHEQSGDFVLIAEEGRWFAYPWWQDRAEAPDFAAHVDIHNKPGFDACELFFGWPPGAVSTNPLRVKGSHGRTGEGRKLAWASTIDFATSPRDLADLGRLVGGWCDAYPG